MRTPLPSCILRASSNDGPFFQVSVDIFKGFPDEESIVNYTLNQAYQDNVTVFASEFLPLLRRSCVSSRPAFSPAQACPTPTTPPVTFLPLSPDLSTSSTSSHISPSPASLWSHTPHAGPATSPLLLLSPAPPLSKTPHLSRCHSWSAPFTVCPPSMPSGHTLHQLPVPRCHLPDTEGRLPPSTCTLQDSPELKLH